MHKIEIIENDIQESLKHLDFMNNAIGSFESLKILFNESKPEIAEILNTDIQNFQAIMAVVGLEICLVLKGIYYSKSDSEKIFLLKKGLLVLYETKILLDKLSPIIKQIKIELPELEKDIIEFTNILKQTKKRIVSESRIAEIRNNTSAHFNPNFLEFYRFIQKIDLKNDLDFLLRTIKILREIDKFLLKVEGQRLKK